MSTNNYFKVFSVTPEPVDPASLGDMRQRVHPAPGGAIVPFDDRDAADVERAIAETERTRVALSQQFGDVRVAVWKPLRGRPEVAVVGEGVGEMPLSMVQ